MKVLVIDDEKGIRELLKVFLQILGHEVVSAKNGPEGIEKCDDSFCLVITDRRMPGMLGEEVIRELKKRYPKIKAVLMTGDDLNEVVKNILIAAGVEEILSKPFKLDKIQQILQQLSG